MPVWDWKSSPISVAARRSTAALIVEALSTLDPANRRGMKREFIIPQKNYKTWKEQTNTDTQQQQQPVNVSLIFISWRIQFRPGEHQQVRLSFKVEGINRAARQSDHPFSTKSMTENCVLLILKETNAAFTRCHVAFFRGFRLAHTHLEVQMQLSLLLSGKYLMPRCTRTERQCLALFVPGAPVFWPPTNGSLFAAL